MKRQHPDIITDSDGYEIAWRCKVCRKFYNQMWGNVCNMCSEARQRSTKIVVIKDSDVVDYWIKSPEVPELSGKYLVQRKDGKIHFENYNGSGWAYNNKTIVRWSNIFKIGNSKKVIKV